MSRVDDWAFTTTDVTGRALAHWLRAPTGRTVVIIEPTVGEHYSAASIAALLDPDSEVSSVRGARSTDLLPTSGRIRKVHRIAIGIAPARFRGPGQGFSNDVVALRDALAWAALADDAEAKWRAHGMDRGLRAEQFASAGMTALEAAPWYDARILPKLARRFAAAGWRPQVAALLGALPAPAESDEDDDAEAFHRGVDRHRPARQPCGPGGFLRPNARRRHRAHRRGPSRAHGCESDPPD